MKSPRKAARRKMNESQQIYCELIKFRSIHTKRFIPQLSKEYNRPSTMSTGNLKMASGSSAATSSMFIPPWAEAMITGPCKS